MILRHTKIGRNSVFHTSRGKTRLEEAPARGDSPPRASCYRTKLNGCGRTCLDLLTKERLPFSYTENESPSWFRVIERRPERRLGFRFYLPSLRRGCITAFGEMPSEIASALATLESAADNVGETIAATTGSLMVASNWFALHDRTRQTINHNHQNREALLCFVGRTNFPLTEVKSPSMPSGHGMSL